MPKRRREHNPQGRYLGTRGRAGAYVREKKVGNKQTGKTYGGYYQLVEGVWEGGKVRQKVLAHLGEHRTLQAAMRATAREIRPGGRAQSEGMDKAVRIEADIRQRWGGRLSEHRYALGLPTPEEAVRKAYPRGWPENPRRGQKFRRAFGLSDEPGEDLKSVGEFVVLLDRFWKAAEEREKFDRAYRRFRHLQNVKAYLEEKRAGKTSARSFEDYARAARRFEEEMAQARLERSSI